MSWSSPRLRDDWGGRLLKARAVVVLPESAPLPMYDHAQAEMAGMTVEGEITAALAEASGLRRGAEEARQLLAQARAEAEELRRDMVRGVGRLACEVASHLMGAAVRLDPDVVREHVAQILAESQPLGILEVVVHPEDMKAARAAKNLWLAEMAGEVEIGVVPDPDLPPGSCRVRTRAGDIEWLWPERLSEMDRAMQEVAKSLGLDA
jgi:flagellar biosynthesis/type III secretory pathway protein FliH